MKHKTLVSWIATRNDFQVRNERNELVNAENRFNMGGPHINLYKNFLNFRTHYLLCHVKRVEDELPISWEFLANYLRLEYQVELILKKIVIEDLMSVPEIKGKMYNFLKTDLHDQDVEVFINPGTPSMQTAWYLLGSEISSVRLFSIKEARFTKSKGQPEKTFIQFDSSDFAKVTNLVEISKDRGQKRPFITESYQETYEKARLLGGNYRTTVLLRGATGTGKELLAKHIHQNSNRSKRKMISINCAAFRGDLLESRLFGYEKGAHSTALKMTRGIFEDANGSTLFLDEIGDITPHMQVSLLRVLQERKIMRIGSTQEINVDVRVISATNKDLWELCKKGLFRYDLLYRLSVAELYIPPFITLSRKEKKEWINYFLTLKRTDFENRRLLGLSDEVWEVLLNYPFDGNIRELEAIIENFYVFCQDNDTVTYEFLTKRVIENKKNIAMTLDAVIKDHIIKSLAFFNGNISKTAKMLEISNNTVKKWIKKQLP